MKWNMTGATPPLTHAEFCELLVVELWRKLGDQAPIGVVVVTMPDSPAYKRQPFGAPRVEYAKPAVVIRYLRDAGDTRFLSTAAAIETATSGPSATTVGLIISSQEMKLMIPVQAAHAGGPAVRREAPR